MDSPALPPPAPSMRQVRRLLRDEVRWFQGQRRQRMRDARRQLARAAKARDTAVGAAERASKAAERRHTRSADDADRAAVRADEGQALACAGGWTLYADRVLTHDGTFDLKPGMSAAVGTSGDLSVSHRPTATRGALGCAACGPLGCLGSLVFPKTEVHDARRVFMVLEGPGVASVVACQPRDEIPVRELAARLNAVAPMGPTARMQRTSASRAARRHALTLRSDRAAIDEAEHALTAAREDTPDMQRAATVLQQASRDDDVQAARALLDSAHR